MRGHQPDVIRRMRTIATEHLVHLDKGNEICARHPLVVLPGLLLPDIRRLLSVIDDQCPLDGPHNGLDLNLRVIVLDHRHTPALSPPNHAPVCLNVAFPRVQIHPRAGMSLRGGKII